MKPARRMQSSLAGTSLRTTGAAARAQAPRSPAQSDPRWNAVIARDSAADPGFVYAVRTTGIYCRPGSPTRLPNPRNVVFFDSAQAAEAAGYRPSRRPAPSLAMVRARHLALVEKACTRLAQTQPAPDLQTLARDVGLSPYYFHRVFKSITGLTPKGFEQALRAGLTRERMRRGSSVTEAMYDSGFGSSARFYANTAHALGMTPTRFRSGGADTDIRFAVGQSSLGAVLVAQSERGVCAILLGDDPHALVLDLQDRFPRAKLIGAERRFERTVARVVGFIETPTQVLDLPLDLRGTVFQMRVWQALREIPPGTTATYAQIAQRIGAPRSVRAVASACGANRIAVAIPCHRVVRSDGSLSGYHWGVERKRELLQRENASHT